MSSREAGDGAAGERERESTAITTWRKLDAAHGRVTNELMRALQQQHSLSINAHAVLAQLMRAPDHKLRMTEIATRIDFSLSGLTGLVGRLEQDGLIERQANLADRRVIFARLTPRGEQYAREADAKHRETLQSLFTAAFNDAELIQLTDLLQRLTQANGHVRARRRPER